MSLPRNGELLRLAGEHITDQALADALGVARSTISDHIRRLGMREQVAAVRGAERVARPDEIPIVHLDFTAHERHYIYPLGDVHIGDASHHEEAWLAWLGFLVDRDDCSMLGTGDFLNSALKDSKSESYDERFTVGDAKWRLCDQLRPIAARRKLDLLMPGNHEARIYRAVGDDPIRDVAKALNVAYAQASALLVYHVGDQEYEVYLRHGTGAGQNVGALSKATQVIRADIYVTGHTHRQAVTLDDRFVRHGAMTREKFYCVSSGSFLGYQRYAAERGYPPSHMGAPRIFLDGRRRDFHISI